ncbi:MAG: peptide deformylase [Candidatus Gracilibacteria bacterium]|nr:peptide deformylase [Candidatus Gracilibacteria bacterium]MDD3120017.1 peptide deformylase [Candidatus Gracilibacteria bacterium]MDD4529990.1 peptide deformylase [Candidatus Gracilibacteria bacterium]
MKFKIETGIDNKILRTTSEEIKLTEISKYAKIGEEMVKYIKNPKNGGAGIAGPQIGINKRIICISLMKNNDDENYKTIYMINPEIVELSGNIVIGDEGCLSVPGFVGEVDRYYRAKVNYLDGKGKKIGMVLEGFPARVFQHESDHLEGILFVDKAKNTEEVKSKK